MRSHPISAAVTVVLGALVGLFTFFVARPAAQFRDIASEQFVPEMAREAIDRSPPPAEDPPPAQEETAELIRFRGLVAPERLTPLQLAMMGSPDLPDDMFTSVLIIGADKSGALADVIVLALLPSDGSPPILASLPRDLWVPNPCTGSLGKINATLNGCDDAATGPELLALAVEDFTGVPIDHYARVNFSGFANLIDWMGGVTVCVDAPTRDAKAKLALDAGCTTAGGDTALAWVRSRTTEQLVGGSWVVVNDSDYVRQRRQQDVLLQLAGKLAGYRSPAALAGALENLSSAVRMDSGWSITQIAALGYRHRDLDLDDVVSVTLPTEDYRSPDGQLALLPGEAFNTTLSEVHPAARTDLVEAG
jgi:LCP family protein required for cell wall assembly